MEKLHIDTVEKINKLFGPLKNINDVHKKGMSLSDRIAMVVTQKVGTLAFFSIIFLWTFVWLGWNIFAPRTLRFDPFPGFVLWLFISNLIQLHLMPLIMIGQNVQGKHAELRAQHDYETDKKAEKEIETILLHLENQQTLILEVLHRIENLEKRK